MAHLLPILFGIALLILFRTADSRRFLNGPQAYTKSDNIFAIQKMIQGLAASLYTTKNAPYQAPRRNELHGEGMYSSGERETNYVPVVVKKKKKKMKIISLDKGFYIPGGSQMFGKFSSLKQCMWACATSASCFAGDYNPWLGTCYSHSNQTACATMQPHSKLTHFKKVPCDVEGDFRARVTLGAMLHGGILMKGVDTVSDCVKKCLSAGGGVEDSPLDLALEVPTQKCFGIDFDFSTHTCYFHVNNFVDFYDSAFEDVFLPLCSPLIFLLPGRPVPTPRDLVANPSVINIIICPP